MLVPFDGVHDGRTNMSRDAELLERAESGKNCGRVYAWNGPWVSLGRFQQASTALLPGAPVQAVERPTGGRAVLHGHDVTLGLAFPLSDLCPREDWRSIRAVYRSAIFPIVEALRACGIDAALGEAGMVGSSRSSDCFAAVSPNDVIERSTGLKVCGCALRLTDCAVLAQCSIPAGPPLVDPGEVYRDPAPVHWVQLDPEAFSSAISQTIQTIINAQIVR